MQGWALPEPFLQLRRLLEARMGVRGKREFIQVLRLMETFDQNLVADAVKDALKLGAPASTPSSSWSCGASRSGRPGLIWRPIPICRRPPFSATRAADYTALLDQEAA